ncbi:hypothetical protein [Sphingomonas sp. VNH70]|uniref:hypothetical protein n=1 Tax=Sphingomonas silueang TaxID=3156617 RepID=UPI0032B54CEB
MDFRNTALNFAGKLDLNAIAEKAGIAPETVEKVLTLLAQYAEHDDPAQEAADHSGVSRHQIEAVLSEVGGADAMGQLARLFGFDSGTGTGTGGLGDVLGNLGGAFGRK